MAEKKDQSTTSLMMLIIAQISGLLRRELDLARAEVSEGMSAAIRGLMLLVIAAIIALTGLNVLAGAAIAILVDQGINPMLAAVIVGGVLVLLAIVLLLRGAGLVKTGSLAPKRAAERMGRSAGLSRRGGK